MIHRVYLWVISHVIDCNANSCLDFTEVLNAACCTSCSTKRMLQTTIFSFILCRVIGTVLTDVLLLSLSVHFTEVFGVAFCRSCVLKGISGDYNIFAQTLTSR